MRERTGTFEDFAECTASQALNHAIAALQDLLALAQHLILYFKISIKLITCILLTVKHYKFKMHFSMAARAKSNFLMPPLTPSTPDLPLMSSTPT